MVRNESMIKLEKGSFVASLFFGRINGGDKQDISSARFSKQDNDNNLCYNDFRLGRKITILAGSMMLAIFVVKLN